MRVQPQPLVDQPQSLGVMQVQFASQMAQIDSVSAVEIAVIRAGGHAGKIEFDAEMQHRVTRETFDQIAHIQHG